MEEQNIYAVQDSFYYHALSMLSNMSKEKNHSDKFKMPTRIRGPFISNACVKAIIPAIEPTDDEVGEALKILGMTNKIKCSYCGGKYELWDHLHPLVDDKKPTGYISEIHNLVPSCSTCNDSKRNEDWEKWMTGTADKSPATRGVKDIDKRIERLRNYCNWKPSTKVNLEKLVGSEQWNSYWKTRDDMVAKAKEIHEKIEEHYASK